MAATWDDCNLRAKADLIAYDQVRGHEERKLLELQLRASANRGL